MRPKLFKNIKKSPNSCNYPPNCITFAPHLTNGVMLEWLKRHAWKACIRQKRIPSSNLGHSARQISEAGFDTVPRYFFSAVNC